MTVRSLSAAALALVALTGCGPVAGAAPSGSKAAGSPADSPAGARSTSAASHTRHATPKPRTHSAPPRAVPAGMCHSGELRVTRREGPDSGAGHLSTLLVFRNASGHACWVRGYPGVSYVTGDAGRQVGAAARRDPHRAPSAARVWLIPNAHAYALLDQPDPLNFPSATCHPTSVRGLRVYPPEETAAIYVPDATTACAKPAGRPAISALSTSTDPPPA